MAFPKKTLKTLVTAGYPIICLLTKDEIFAETILKEFITNTYGEESKIEVCDATIENPDKNSSYPPALAKLASTLKDEEKKFIIAKDIHFYLEYPEAIRILKNFYNNNYEKPQKYLFMLSPTSNIPQDLEREITVVDIPLPDPEEIKVIFQKVISRPKNSHLQQDLSSSLQDKLINAIRGLGISEIELALSRVFLGKQKLDEKTVDELLEEKAQLIRKTGTLEFIKSNISLREVGGLENLKQWLETRALAFSSIAKEHELDTPKGILIMGISGCGKSLCAKAVANAWNLPLVRFDLDQVYGGLWGKPEDIFRRSIKTVEAIAPCVLWIDEIEAGIARSGEKTSDSPASRIFGFFLTWMQEKRSPVFVTATANQIDLLPPEILRKGRFDEIFFVTLPNQKERKEIFEIHLRRRGKDPSKFDLDSLAKNSEGLSGAEIEQAIISASFEAFSKNKELDNTELIIAISSIVPLSTTMREEISKLERWASNRALKASLD